MSQVSEILLLGDKRVIISDDPDFILLDDFVIINNVKFHVLPGSGSMSNTFAIENTDYSDYDDAFFIGSEIVQNAA